MTAAALWAWGHPMLALFTAAAAILAAAALATLAVLPCVAVAWAARYLGLLPPDAATAWTAHKAALLRTAQTTRADALARTDRAIARNTAAVAAIAAGRWRGRP